MRRIDERARRTAALRRWKERLNSLTRTGVRLQVARLTAALIRLKQCLLDSLIVRTARCSPHDLRQMLDEELEARGAEEQEGELARWQPNWMQKRARTRMQEAAVDQTSPLRATENTGHLLLALLNACCQLVRAVQLCALALRLSAYRFVRQQSRTGEPLRLALNAGLVYQLRSARAQVAQNRAVIALRRCREQASFQGRA